MASGIDAKATKGDEATRTALGAMSVKEIKNALHAGKRVSVMLGSSDLKRGDKEVAWIGAVLAEACEDYHVDVAVGNMPGLVDVGLEIVRRIRRIEDEGVPYGVASNVEALGSKSPYRGVDLARENVNAEALAVATAEMESIIWNQNVWPVLIQLTDQNTMLGFLAGHEMFPYDEGGRPIPVDAAVAFLEKDGNMSCGYIRSFRDEAYSVIAEKLSMNRVDIGEESIPLVLEEARQRKDADVIAHVAEWFEDRNDIKQYLELAMEAAELGSAEANFWLGHEYRSGENLPRDYEKAYSCFTKGKDVDWVPIDPEENTKIMDGNGGEVTAEALLLHGDIEWWLFVLKKHPTRALKCGLADWYMKHGGDENREKALKLLEGTGRGRGSEWVAGRSTMRRARIGAILGSTKTDRCPLWSH